MTLRVENLAELVLERARLHPDDTLYTFLENGETPSRSLTFADVSLHAKAVAAELQARVAPKDRAVLVFAPGLDFIGAFLGCQLAGVIAVPVYPPQKASDAPRIAAILKDCAATIVLTQKDYAPIIASSLEAMGLAGLAVLATDAVDLGAASAWRMPTLTPDCLSFLQYTSGSTGTPKGAMVSHGNLLHNERQIYEAFQNSREAIGVSWLPQYHDMGLIGGILQPLFMGGRCYLMSPFDFLQRPLRWLEAVTKYRAYVTGGPNFAYALCAARATDEEIAKLDLSSWRVAVNGAEPIRLATLERFAERFAPSGFRREAFFPSFGLAESTLMVTAVQVADPPRALYVDASQLEKNTLAPSTVDAPGSRALVGCGKPKDQIVRIVDPSTLKPCEAGRIGEIWVRGGSVALGYWGRPEATKETFGAHIAGTGEGPFMRTGDLGVLDGGDLFVTGRLKELIIVDGRNHYPQDIEETIQRGRSALRSGCGTAFSVDVEGAERLVIVQEIAKGHEGDDLAALAATIRASVAEKHGIAPNVVALVPHGTVQKTSSGKLRRRRMRELFLQGALAVAHESKGSAPPRPLPTRRSANDLERMIARLVGAHVSTAPGDLDVTTPFSLLGLDSLSLVTLSGELQDELGRKLEPQIFYTYSTIAELARFLSEDAARPASAPATEATPAPAASREPIAIVGMACRFPGAPDLAAYWRLLASGTDAITEVPPARWNAGEWFDADPTVAGKMTTRWGGFVEGVDQFDADFFGIPAREAAAMDPQQRLLLELVWHALEDGGLVPARLRGSRTGVYVGISGNDYGRLQMGTTALLAPQAGTGNALSINANRLSYFFDWRGPSLAIDTACSSALAAIHEAALHLAAGECDLAVVGAVNLTLAPDVTVSFSQARMMAADGRCKTFSAEADGYVRSEGAGVLVLKRLSEAQSAGDTIWGVISGSACTQDGRSNGLTAPNGRAQRATIDEALRRAGWQPADVQLVETHGTGTRLGDPIEAEALGAAYGEGRPAGSPLLLGAVKSQIGHLEAAAGMASVIKTALAMKHGVVPANLHCADVNPLVALDAWKLALPRAARPWPACERRRAGVSAFGFGGTNVHVLLEEAPASEAAALSTRGHVRPIHVLPLSAKSDASLDRAMVATTALLRSGVDGAALCHTAALRRQHLREARRAVLGANADELAAALEAAREGKEGSTARATKRGIAFLFTGQGAQYVNMGRRLYEGNPDFQAVVDRCDAALRAVRGTGILELLYPSAHGADASAALLTRTENAQPALYAIECALAALYRSWRVEPTVMTGHSLGEFAAAAVAGVFSLEDGLKLVEARGRLMQGVPVAGGMLAVFAHERDVEPLLARVERRLVIAAYNGPGQLVLSGPEEELDAARAFCAHHGIEAKPLRVSHAFHSPLMEPMVDAFRRVAESITYQPPLVPIVSNLTGRPETARIASAGYWIQHAVAPVRFAQGIEHLRQMDVGTLLEIGPRPVLVGMARRILPSSTFAFVASLDADKDEWRTVAQSMASLYEGGAEIDWERWNAPYATTHAPAALYSFERKRHWFDASEQSAPAARAASHGDHHPLLGRPLTSPRIAKGERHFEGEVRLPGPAFFRLTPEPLERRVSLLAYLDIALEAQHTLMPGSARYVRQIGLEGLLKVARDEARTVQTLCSPLPSGEYAMEVWTHEANEEWRRVASAMLCPGEQAIARSETLDVVQARIGEVLDVDTWYQTTRDGGLHYWSSPRKAIHRLWWAPSEVLASVSLVDEDDASSGGLWLKHSTWHACYQVMGAICPRDGHGTYFPVSLERFHFFAEPGKRLFVHAHLLDHAVENPHCTLDVTIYREDGARVAEIRGIRMVPDETQRRPREEWRKTKVEDRPQLLAEALRRAASWVFKRPPEEIPVTEPLALLGLDSLGALEIAVSVERMFEVGIDLAQLQQGATIVQLAAALDARLGEAEGSTASTATASSPLVDIHRGDASLTPLFLVHPTGGTVFCYQELARHLGSQPVVGVRSVDEAPEIATSLEARAAKYLRAIRKRQPRGPYLLGGWSMGGVLAFEMARQLEADREEVGMLLLLDAPAPGRATRVAPEDGLRLFAQGLGIELDDASIASFDGDREAAIKGLLEAMRSQRSTLRIFGASDLRRWMAEFERNFAILSGYQGGAYSGSATLLCAETPLAADNPDASGADWGRWLATVDATHTLPGDHFSLLSGSHVTLTASYVRKALRATRGSQASIRVADRGLSLVHERPEATVVIAKPVRSRDGAARAALVVNEAHPYFFDHPLDHVTGALVLEGMLQLVEASEGSADRYVRVLRATFPRFCEKDRPTSLDIAPTVEGDLQTCRALQDKIPVCVMKFQTDAAASAGPSSRASASWRTRARPPVTPADAKLLHKAHAENVLVGAWRIDGGRVQAPLLEPPPGHQLGAGDPEGLSPLYVLEATRQLVTGIAHAEYQVPLGTPMNLVAVEILLHDRIPRGAPLRLEHVVKAASPPFANQFSHFDVTLKSGDQALAECRLTAQMMTMETYLRVRRQRVVAAA